MADFEIKLIIKNDLSDEDKKYIHSKIAEIADMTDMVIQADGITYSKRPPYKKFEDFHPGVVFFFKLQKFEKYFSRLDYYSYLEGTKGDKNGNTFRLNENEIH